jgi:hypothetical protein
METMQVSFRLPHFIVDRLKSEARRISYEQRRNVQWTSLVKEALFKHYPITEDEILRRVPNSRE